MSTIGLTTEMFAERVADIESVLTNWRYRGDKPAILDFYASWCAPYRVAIDRILLHK